MAFGSKYALGMELYAVDIIVTVAEGHDLSFGTFGGDLEAFREVLARDYPGVVATHREFVWKSREERFVRTTVDGGLHAVKDGG